VDRAVALLKAVATSATPPSLADLAAACRLNRVTAWRLLTALERHGLVERDAVSLRYFVGYEAVQLASSAKDYGPLIRPARHALQRLCAETGATVNLSIPTHNSIVTIDQIDGRHLVTVNWVGRSAPLHCTSLGKLLLSSYPKEKLDSFLRHPLQRYTPSTLTNPARLRKEIESVKRRGYGVALGEFEEGFNGLSAPVTDRDGRHIAYVSVSGPAYRIPRERLKGIARSVVRAAEEVRRRLGQADGARESGPGRPRHRPPADPS